VLQCVAVCCGALQCFSVWCSVLKSVAEQVLLCVRDATTSQYVCVRKEGVGRKEFCVYVFVCVCVRIHALYIYIEIHIHICIYIRKYI